jgi:hypothetical protein
MGTLGGGPNLILFVNQAVTKIVIVFSRWHLSCILPMRKTEQERGKKMKKISRKIEDNQQQTTINTNVRRRNMFSKNLILTAVLLTSSIMVGCSNKANLVGPTDPTPDYGTVSVPGNPPELSKGSVSPTHSSELSGQAIERLSLKKNPESTIVLRGRFYYTDNGCPCIVIAGGSRVELRFDGGASPNINNGRFMIAYGQYGQQAISNCQLEQVFEVNSFELEVANIYGTELMDNGQPQ